MTPEQLHQIDQARRYAEQDEYVVTRTHIRNLLAIIEWQAASVPEGYEIVHSGEIVHLRRNFATQIGCERGEAHYWQGDGQDFPDSLACPVVMHANTLREMLSALTDLAGAAEAGMACILERSPKLKLNDPANSPSWNCPEYDNIAHEVKRVRAMLAAAPEAPKS